MKEKENKRNEQKINSVKYDRENESGREHIKPLKKETMEERAKRENWTDVAESHLGIDE